MYIIKVKIIVVFRILDLAYNIISEHSMGVYQSKNIIIIYYISVMQELYVVKDMRSKLKFSVGMKCISVSPEI